MELQRERPIATEAEHIIDWPQVPRLSLIGTQATGTEIEVIDNPTLTATKTQDIQETKVTPEVKLSEAKPPDARSPDHLDHTLRERDTATDVPRQQNVTKSSKSQLSGRLLSNLAFFTSKKSSWSSPQLSIGTKCSKMGDRECWEAVGPAQELFAQLSQPIGRLLDSRVEEIEEGEPVVNILTYGMYMIGRDLSTARPTLVFTCQRPKPRRRAIKFLKESDILQGHPKISLAESAIVPAAPGMRYLKLLAGRFASYLEPSSTKWTPKRDTQLPTSVGPTPSLSAGAIAGIVIASLTFVFFLAAFAFCCLRKRKFKQELRNHLQTPSEMGPIPHTPYHNNKLAKPQLIIGPLLDNTLAKPQPMVGPLLENPVRVPVSPTPMYSPLPLSVLSPVGDLVMSSDPVPPQMRSNLSGLSPSKSVGGVHTKFPVPSAETVSSQSSTIFRGMTAHANKSMDNSKENRPKSPVKIHSMTSLIHCPALYGVSIFSSETGKFATMGGIVFSRGLFYGLTSRHSVVEATEILEGIQEDVNDASPDNEDFEFAFDSQEEDLSEVDVSDAIITSQASVSSAATISRISSTASGSYGNAQISIPSSEKAVLPDIDTRIHGSDVFQVVQSKNEHNQNVGHFVTSSSTGHDWALIELSASSVEDAAEAASKDNVMRALSLPLQLAPRPVANVDVVAIKGDSCISRGTLSPSSTMMKLQQSGSFLEVFPVRFDDPLVQGDSGSWVFNQISGDLYGHIVAGIPDTGLAYILPAYRTFQEIEGVLGSVQLASTVLAGVHKYPKTTEEDDTGTPA